jgi:hypothetical protein
LQHDEAGVVSAFLQQEVDGVLSAFLQQPEVLLFFAQPELFASLALVHLCSLHFPSQLSFPHLSHFVLSTITFVTEEEKALTGIINVPKNATKLNMINTFFIALI